MSHDTWNPHTLMECVDSEILGWTTGVLALGMLIWYLMIAYIWLKSRRRASAGGKSVWGWLIAIFIVCAMAGYVSWILALFIPKLAVIFRLFFLTAQNIVCPFFWIRARKYEFHLRGAYERIAEEISKLDTQHLSDRDLAAYAREVVGVALERVVVKRGGGLSE